MEKKDNWARIIAMSAFLLAVIALFYIIGFFIAGHWECTESTEKTYHLICNEGTKITEYIFTDATADQCLLIPKCDGDFNVETIEPKCLKSSWVKNG